MSSSISKIQSKIELKKENAWLKNAFRRAYAAAQEQSDNAAELSRSLWLAAQQNGGELTVKIGKGLDGALGAGIPAGAKLRARTNGQTGEVTYIAHVEPMLEIIDEESTPEALFVGDEDAVARAKAAYEQIAEEHAPALKALADGDVGER